MSLPAGWTGNNAHHHRDIGIIRASVTRLGAPAVQGWRWDIYVMRARVAGSGPTLADLSRTPEAARAAAIQWIRTFAEGVLREVAP